MTEVWTRWEGQVVNGAYPLRRFLNASSHSAVFLTESTTEGFLNAAIKIIPTETSANEGQIWRWKTATTFHHPHLVGLLDSGNFELQGRNFLYVVMEYAEENLAQILPYRALSPDEVRELFVPALDALAFLHRENWVQGQLKPSNVLVVDDQIKLASDTIRPIGMARTAPAHSSIYDAPETDEGDVSSAGDIWSLGVTLVEALTQYAPSWPDGKTAPALLPSNLPAEFRETIERCLSADPGDRPTVAELQVQTSPRGSSANVPAPAANAAPAPNVGKPANPAGSEYSAAAAPSARPSNPATAAASATPSAGSRPISDEATPSTAEPVMRATPRALPPSFEEHPDRSSVIPTVLTVVVVLAACWGGWKWFHGRSEVQLAGPATTGAVSESPSRMEGEPTGGAREASSRETTDSLHGPATAARGAAPAVPQSGAPPAVTEQPTQSEKKPVAPPASTPPESSPAPGMPSEVVHEELPNASPGARSTIHGHVKVLVRVWVDRSGNVVRSEFEHPSSSGYFNRLAGQAARKWKFSTVDSGGHREWVLQFEFGRDGTTARTVRRPS